MFFDNVFWYLFICLFFFGISDYLSVLTRAKLSSVFVSLMLFLVCFMSGAIPADIIHQGGLSQIGKWALGFVVFSMGTTVNMRELIQEWRTVATAVCSMLVVAASMFVLVPLIGYNEVIVAIPILNGGIVATQVMTSAAMEQGFTIAAGLGTILYAVQKFFGTPVASYFGMKEAKKIVEQYRATGINPYRSDVPKENKRDQMPTFFERYKKYYGQFVCLSICAFFAWCAFCIGKMTGLSYTIWCLLLGATISSLGLVPKNILMHAKSSGIFNVAVFATIIPSLAKIQLGDLLILSYSTIAIFIVLFIAIYIAFAVLPLWKIQGSKNIAMAVAMCQLLGFPATYLIANEVAQGATETEAEKQVVLDAIMTKYLVGGFATVTSFSVIIAGIFEKFIAI